MIVYDLECAPHAHRFEGWFGSSQDFADQQARGLLTCPVCASAEVTKAVMAPNIARKGNQLDPHAPETASLPAPATPVPMAARQPIPPEALAMLHTIAKLQAEALKSSTWVGPEFADSARAIHYGEKDAAPIHGEATPDEARAMIEEGIDIAPLLIPAMPARKIN